MSRRSPFSLLMALLALSAASGAGAQEARARWERMCQIRQEKFDLVLPEAMRENGIDMWIVMMREGNLDPLYEDLGRGYVGGDAYWVFTDRGGERIERVTIGVGGYMLEQCPVYDRVGVPTDLASFVAERDPQRIGINVSRSIGGADGLSHTMYEQLVETLGERYAGRLVSAEKLVSDFRSRRVASEIVAFAEAGEMSREIAERAFSNEVITPGVTTLEDVAWWMQDRLLERGLQSSFDMPSVYVTGPNGIEATSTDRIIQRGDLLMIDWGVGFLNFFTDMKRVAYVLRAGETEPPSGIRHAFAEGLRVRDIVKRVIRPGRTAGETLDLLNAAAEAEGFRVQEVFNQVTNDQVSEVMIGSHSVGNQGHGVGPSIAFFNPTRMTYKIRPSNLLSIEFFVWVPAPEWGGKKVRIPLEDDAIVTDRGVEWLYPVNPRIRLIK